MFLHCCARMLGALCSDMGAKILTTCGVPVTHVELQDDTLSEVLRLYLKEGGANLLPEVGHAHCGLP